MGVENDMVMENYVGAMVINTLDAFGTESEMEKEHSISMMVRMSACSSPYVAFSLTCSCFDLVLIPFIHH